MMGRARKNPWSTSTCFPRMGGRKIAVLFVLTTTASMSTSLSLGLQQQQQQNSISPVNSRRGAKHIQGKGNYKARDILTPQELQELANLQALRTPGSLKHTKGWGHWSNKSLDAIRFQLSQNLPDPADADGFGELFFHLGTAADRGEMPSFADAGSRSGYALEFFCRARLLSDLLYDKCSVSSRYPKDILDCSLYSKMGHVTDDPQQKAEKKTIQIVSLGGGPGYDYVGVLLADMFGNAGYSQTTVEGIIFDYEEGWGSLVGAMDIATQAALVNDNNKSSVAWGGKCDITKPLADPTNAACLKKVPTTDMFICQYCVAENAKGLRDSDFCFFADLFEKSADDTIFVFTEVTPRVWPDIVDILRQRPDQGDGFQLKFLRAIKRNGQQMVIQKRTGASLCPDELVVAEEFRELQRVHQRKLDNGFQRQPKKVRGGKVL